MRIKLSEREFKIIHEAVSFCKIEIPSEVIAGLVEDISDETASVLRDCCEEYLLHIGFDEQYEPNDEGKILETLIDKLYVK